MIYKKDGILNINYGEQVNKKTFQYRTWKKSVENIAFIDIISLVYTLGPATGQVYF